MHSKGQGFVIQLKACSKLRNLQQGIKIHREVSKLGLLPRDCFLGSTLVDMYAKCGSMIEAQTLFEELSLHDVVSWTALIKGYVENGNAGIALKCFQQMQLDHVVPDAITYICCLKACGVTGDQNFGHTLHMEIVTKGLFDIELNLGNALVDLYVKCRSLTDAHHIFDTLVGRDVVSWTALIAGYVEDGQFFKVFQYIEEMQIEGVLPNSATFVCSLKASANTKNLANGCVTHAEVERRGLFEKDIILGNTLIYMYAKCGAIHLAHCVFDKLHVRDVVSWTTMLMGYTEYGHGEQALMLFEKMQQEGTKPNTATLICALKSCAIAKATQKGLEIHDYIKRLNLLEMEYSLGTSLVDMYAKCGLIEQAQEMFNHVPIKDVVSWNALLTGYSCRGHNQKVFHMFEQMLTEGVLADVTTALCFLRACTGTNASSKAVKLHAQIFMQDLFDDVIVGTALMDTYAKCGNLVRAQEVFDELPIRDVISWTALTASYADHGCGEEALRCLEAMQVQGFLPNLATLVSSLKACGTIGAFEQGRELHVEIERKDLLNKDLAVGNTLIDMYSKCGVIYLAQQVFDKLFLRDVVSWNSLIAGYSQQKQSTASVHLLERMLLEGIHPNAVTLLIVLNICSRVGFFALSQTYFDSMSKNFGIVSNQEHHSSMIHLLGQSGQFEKAVSLLKEKPTPLFWRSVLSACRSCTNMRLGIQMFEYAVGLDASRPPCCAC